MLQDQLLPQRCIAGRCGLESENSKARPGYSGALVSFRAVLGADRVRGYHMLCLIRSGAQFAKQQAGSLVCEWTIRSLKPRDYGLSILVIYMYCTAWEKCPPTVDAPRYRHPQPVSCPIAIEGSASALWFAKLGYLPSYPRYPTSSVGTASPLGWVAVALSSLMKALPNFPAHPNNPTSTESERRW